MANKKLFLNVNNLRRSEKQLAIDLFEMIGAKPTSLTCLNYMLDGTARYITNTCHGMGSVEYLLWADTVSNIDKDCKEIKVVDLVRLAGFKEFTPDRNTFWVRLTGEGDEDISNLHSEIGERNSLIKTIKYIYIGSAIYLEVKHNGELDGLGGVMALPGAISNLRANNKKENHEKTLVLKVQCAVNEFEKATNVKIKSIDIKHTKAIGERGVSSVMINRVKEQPKLPKGFTRHTGSTMPEELHPRDMVEVVLRNVHGGIRRAESWDWEVRDIDADIIGYKVIKKHVSDATPRVDDAVIYNGKQVRLTQDEAAKMLMYLIELRGGCAGNSE